MDWLSIYYLFASIFYVTIIAENSHIRTIDAQQDERIRLECTVTSKSDAEEAMWMRIRPPHNPDILTYRDTVVYAPDRIELEQRRLSSSINSNGSLIDTYFLTLTILRPNIEDEGRYVCSRGGKTIFAEYDLYIIVPPQFDDDDSFIRQRTVIEGTALQLSCSATGRPKPSIAWFYRTQDRKHIPLDNGSNCQQPVCELRLANYSRNGPTQIECVADNEKSPRKSKIFNIEVFYPPIVTANVQTFTGPRSVEVLIQCTSVANPTVSVIWLDSNREEIYNSTIFTIKKLNQSSILSFSAYPQRNLSTIFYCRSSNSIGDDEKLINISNFIQLNSLTMPETTTIPLPIFTVTQDLSQLKKRKTPRSSSARSKPSVATTEVPLIATTITRTTTLTSSSSSIRTIYSFSNNLFYLVLSLFVCCF